jgi:Fic family protein
MKWIWENNNWPHFTYDKTAFDAFEKEFHQNTGVIIGALRFISTDEQEELRVTILSEEAVDTSKIEGEFLDRDSVQSSVRKNLGLQTDGRRVKPQEAGTAQMLVDLFKDYDSPLTHETLFRWHAMTMNGRTDIEVVGGYRQHAAPMQIVSGRLDTPKVFYEAPPSILVAGEMNQYINWFNTTLEQGFSSVVHAGIAHLYFELIHPFEDGNGRIGRCIAEKSLAISAGQPLIMSLSRVLEHDKKSYYQALERANASLEITDWLRYFSQKIIDSQRHVQQLVGFIIAKAKFFQQHSGKLNQRQQKVILRIFREGLHGFKGGLSAENYIRIAQTSRATATRDLQELVSIGALTKEGKLRHTRYYLSLNES